jgi:DNA-directed RNA polymerase specialized sigma24 family protein
MLCSTQVMGQLTGVFSVQTISQEKDRTLTPSALHKLLNWLDEGVNSEGQKYLQMRQRLVAYFDRKNCLTPDELADQTLNRVARRLEAEGVIESDTPAKYCYIVARFVFMEHLRKTQKENVLLGEIGRQPQDPDLATSDADDKKEAKEKMLNCLEQCTGKLGSPNREVITRYYTGKERIKIKNRHALAAELGITMNALRIRAYRIRDKLEDCVRQCVGAD